MSEPELGRAVLELSTDGTKLTKGLDDAKAGAKGLEGTFKSAGESAKAFSSALSSVFGERLEQNARASATAILQVGGATKLTDAEAKTHLATLNAWIDKAKRLGTEVPPHILQTRDALKKAGQEANTFGSRLTDLGGSVKNLAATLGVGFAVGSVVAFGKSVFDAASEIHDVSEKLGISAEAAQGFKFAAEQAGSSLDAVGTALTKMNSHLAEGDKSTVKALKDAGLSFQTIRNMKPEDAFLAITDAVAKIPDPMVQSDVALKLFGKSAAELLPAIKEGFRGAADGATKMSNETVNSLEAAQDAWEKLANKVTIVTGGIIADIIDSQKHLAKYASEQQFGAGTAFAAALNEGLAKHGSDINLPVEDHRHHKTAEELAEEEAARKKAAAAAEKYAEVVREIFAASVPLTLQQKEQIVALEKLGISTSKIAEYLKISEAPIGKFTEALKEQAKAIAAIGKEIAKIPQNVPLRLPGRDLSGIVPMIDVKAVQAASGAVKQISDATFGDIEGRMRAMGVQTASELGRLAVVARERFESMRASGLFTADELAVAWKRSQAATDAAIGKTSGLFGSLMADLGKIPGMIVAAFQGGGGGSGAAKAAGAMLGSTLGTHIADSLKKNGGKLFQGALGDVFSQAIPVLGSLIGPLAGALWNKLFGTAGRDAVKDFVSGFGGFDAFHAMLAEKLPADAERLWIALTQGVGRNNPAEAKKIIDEITKALEAQKAKTTEAADAAVESSSKQQEALDGITAKYADTIAAIDSEYKSLSDSVAQEAAEDVMGLVETQQRARLQQLEDEKKAVEAQRDAEIEAKRETFSEVLGAAQTVDRQLRDLFGKPLEIPVIFNTPAGGYPVSSPGLFLPGGGASSSFPGASASRATVIENRVILDGREIARNQVRHLPNALADVGIRSR